MEDIMKRFISLFLALVMCLSMAACFADEEREDEKDEEKIEKAEKEEKEEPAKESEEYKAAKALLDEGKVKEAYEALYAIRDDANAKALMEKFIVVPTKEETEGGSVTKYEYSEEGLKEKESIYCNDRLESSRIYSYEEGRCIKETLSFNGQGTKQYTYHEYNSDGLLSKSKTEYGGSVSEIEYFYNGDEKCVKQVSRDSAGNEYVIEFEYDNNGNPVKEISKQGGVVASTTTYKLDGEGRVIEITTEYARYGGSDTIKMTYNTDGIVAVQTFMTGNEKHYDMVFFYNQKHGSLTSIERHYPDGRKEKVKDYSGFEFYYVG